MRHVTPSTTSIGDPNRRGVEHLSELEGKHERSLARNEMSLDTGWPLPKHPAQLKLSTLVALCRRLRFGLDRADVDFEEVVRGALERRAGLEISARRSRR